MANLNGKIALITGGSGGIGREIALALARQGAALALHAHGHPQRAHALQQEIIQGGSEALVVEGDLSQPGAAPALISALTTELESRFGSPQFDILINNAGKGGRKSIESVTEAEFAESLQINLAAPFFLIQQSLPYLRDGGRIINISSIATRSAWPEMAAYAPTKAGLEALTLLLAQQLGARGITVNAVLPGATATAMNPRAQDPAEAEQVAKQIALGRVGQPQDIAAVVAFLASEQGGWITGQRIDASGGQRL